MVSPWLTRFGALALGLAIPPLPIIGSFLWILFVQALPSLENADAIVNTIFLLGFVATTGGSVIGLFFAWKRNKWFWSGLLVSLLILVVLTLRFLFLAIAQPH